MLGRGKASALSEIFFPQSGQIIAAMIYLLFFRHLSLVFILDPHRRGECASDYVSKTQPYPVFRTGHIPARQATGQAGS